MAEARNAHKEWKDSLKERKRDAKINLKLKTAAMNQQERKEYTAGLWTKLKRKYITTLKDELMEPSAFVREFENDSEEHQIILYDKFDKLE